LSYLVLNNLGHSFARDQWAFRNLNLSLPKSGRLVVLGPSGVGKSTLLKIISGLLIPTEGRVEFGGRSPTPSDRKKTGYLPQRLGLVENKSAIENALIGAVHRIPTWKIALGLVPEEEITRAQAALEATGLGEKACQPAWKLSGGERRRLALARTLVQGPELLIADEFCSELDPETAGRLVQLLNTIHLEKSLTWIMVEHEESRARALADTLLWLKPGSAPVLEILEPSKEVVHR